MIMEMRDRTSDLNKWRVATRIAREYEEYLQEYDDLLDALFIKEILSPGCGQPPFPPIPKPKLAKRACELGRNIVAYVQWFAQLKTTPADADLYL